MRQSQIATSHWQVIKEPEFRRLWQEELQQIAPYTESRFYLVTGLLLPIWNRINTSSMRVWRMQTDDGQNLLGRMIPAEHIGHVYRNLGLDEPQLSPEDAYKAVHEHKETVNLGRWKLRSSQISGQRRLEVIGFNSKAESDLLKTYGCFSEIIQWRLRLFVPANDNAIPIIGKLMQAT
jgi:hypothetical protein